MLRATFVFPFGLLLLLAAKGVAAPVVSGPPADTSKVLIRELPSSTVSGSTSDIAPPENGQLGIAPPGLAPPGLAQPDTAAENAAEKVVQTVDAAAPACGQLQEKPLRDQVWMVSTRRLGFPSQRCDPKLQVSQWDGCRRFNPSTIKQLLACDDPRYTTVIYVHGNRIETSHATSTGFEAYRMLKQGRKNKKLLRLIVWSWPSQQVVYRTLRDIVLKLDRTVAEEYYLAWFLARMNPERPVSLIGYSFGGRICAGAMQLRAGGTLGGYRLQNLNASPAPTRMTLIAAAADSAALTPCGKYPQMMAHVQDVLVLYNTVDPALLLYPLIDNNRPAALGRVGPVYSGPGAHKIKSYNCSRTIGRTHSVHRYFTTPNLMRLINRNVYWEE